MAKALLTPLSEVDGYRRRPTDSFGKLRELYFKIVNGAVAGDDGSVAELGWLPPGAVRLLPKLTHLRCTAFGASRVLKIGHRKYFFGDGASDFVAEDDDAFSSAIDISGATADVTNPFGATVKYDIYSKTGVRLFGTVTDGTFPANAELEGYIAYAYE